MYEDSYVRLQSLIETLKEFYLEKPTDEVFLRTARDTIQCVTEISGSESGYYPYLMDNVVMPASEGFSKERLASILEALENYSTNWSPWKNDGGDTKHVKSHSSEDKPVSLSRTDSRVIPTRQIRRRYCQYDVFLSYATVDSKLADAINEKFSNLRIKCFMAHHDIELGDEWLKNIRLALLSSGIFVALITENSYQRSWVLTEIGGAWTLGIPMIPIIDSRININSLASPISSSQGYMMDDAGDLSKFVSHVSDIVDTAQRHGYTVRNHL